MYEKNYEEWSGANKCGDEIINASNTVSSW